MRIFGSLAFACLAFFAATTNCCGQLQIWKKGQTAFPVVADELNVESGANPGDIVEVKTLELTPAAENQPALKYQFWVAPALREPGQVNSGLSRAIAMYLGDQRRVELDGQYADATRELDSLAIPVSPKLLEWLEAHRDILAIAYDALDKQNILFDTSHPPGVSGVKLQETRLKRLPHFRAIARIIQVDATRSMELGDYDAATDKLAAGFRLAEFTHQTDGTLVGRLVSIAVSGIMLGCVSEMQQQADAPNMHWALATLPDSLWERKSVVHGEMAAMDILMGSVFDSIPSDATNREIEQQLVAAATAFLVLEGSSGSSENGSDALARLLAGTAVLVSADRGRIDLATFGWSDQQIDKLSPAACVAHSLSMGLAIERDRVMKWDLLGRDGSSHRDKALQESESPSGVSVPARIVMGIMTPAIQAADSASNRIESITRRLMLISALRAYASENEGQLPENLYDPGPLPFPVEPVSGRAFKYKRQTTKRATIQWNPLYPGENSRWKLQVR